MNIVREKFPLQKNERLFLKHKHNDSLLQEFSIFNPLTYINDYTPNIFHYPISFASYDSFVDYITQKIKEDVAKFASGNISIPQFKFSHNAFAGDSIRNLELVKGSHWSNCQYIPEWSSEAQFYSIMQVTMKALWHASAIKHYGYDIVNFYSDHTKIAERRITEIYGLDATKYLIYDRKRYEPVNDNLISRIYQAEILTCDDMVISNIIMVDSIDKINLIRLMLDVPNLAYVSMQELIAFEQNFYEGNCNIVV